MPYTFILQRIKSLLGDEIRAREDYLQSREKGSFQGVNLRK